MTSPKDMKNLGLNAAMRLLERKAEASYTAEWTHLLARQQETMQGTGTSLVIFRLDQEWFAIDCKVFLAVITARKVHSIPHNTNKVLKGLVNYKGQLTVCVDLHRFLGVDTAADVKPVNERFVQMAAIKKEHELWIFPVDEVQGVYGFNSNLLGNTPVTITKSTKDYFRGVFRGEIEWKNKDISYLDEELLFFGLKRNLM